MSETFKVGEHGFNEFLDFYHVVEKCGDVIVTKGYYAPYAYVVDGEIELEDDPYGWRLSTLLISGQEGGGHIMHAGECLTDHLAERMSDGMMYVVMPIFGDECDDECGDAWVLLEREAYRA